MAYIAVEGPIGVGKTSLSRLLAEALDARLALEVVEENPFLAPFYQDPDGFAFKVQVFFLLSRYRQMQDLHQGALFYPHTVSDYLFEKDFYLRLAQPARRRVVAVPGPLPAAQTQAHPPRPGGVPALRSRPAAAADLQTWPTLRTRHGSALPAASGRGLRSPLRTPAPTRSTSSRLATTTSSKTHTTAAS